MDAAARHGTGLEFGRAFERGSDGSGALLGTMRELAPSGAGGEIRV